MVELEMTPTEIGFWGCVVFTSLVALRVRGYLGFLIAALMAVVVVGRLT